MDILAYGWSLQLVQLLASCVLNAILAEAIADCEDFWSVVSCTVCPRGLALGGTYCLAGTHCAPFVAEPRPKYCISDYRCI